MADVMLSSGSSEDPSKPFKIRIQELRARYDVGRLFVLDSFTEHRDGDSRARAVR